MAQVSIHNNGQRVAKTTRAMDVSITKELMRAYTMQATFANTDQARAFLTQDSLLEVEGQLFDMTGYQMDSGSTNTTQVSGEHVAYRLNNYILPTGYAFVGTVKQIAQDILNTAKDADNKAAATEFSVGTTGTTTTHSFALENDMEVTARSALFSLKAVGVEVEFDNFKLNFPVRSGTGKTKTFRFGTDLCSFNRSWDRDNGATYTAAIADLQRLPGHEAEAFDVGDDVIIEDAFIGDTTKKRVISYTKVLDHPEQDSITMGVFVRDSSDQSISMQVEIDNSVHQGEQYSNVSITHADGFKAENVGQNLRVLMNANDCFAVQVKKGNEWVTVNSLTVRGLSASLIENMGYPGTGAIIGKGPESGDGTGLFLYDDYTKEQDVYFKIWPTVDGNVTQEIVRGKLNIIGANKKVWAQMDESVLRANAFSGFDSNYSGIVIGRKDSSGSYPGLYLYDHKSENMGYYLEIWPAANNNVVLQSKRNGQIELQADKGTYSPSLHAGNGVTGWVSTADWKLTITDGIITGLESYQK